jgi:hypothetical protein
MCPQNIAPENKSAKKERELNPVSTNAKLIRAPGIERREQTDDESGWTVSLAQTGRSFGRKLIEDRWVALSRTRQLKQREKTNHEAWL